MGLRPDLSIIILYSYYYIILLLLYYITIIIGSWDPWSETSFCYNQMAFLPVDTKYENITLNEIFQLELCGSPDLARSQQLILR